MKSTKHFKKAKEIYEVTMDKDQKIEKIIIRNPQGADVSNIKSERIKNLEVTIEITPMDKFEEKSFSEWIQENVNK